MEIILKREKKKKLFDSEKINKWGGELNIE
jgi:hypothetical protein